MVLYSDVHLAGPKDPHQQAFLDHLRSAEADRLCLLGDIFHHWWDFGGQPFDAYSDVIAALRPWAGRLVFVPGNHDFRAAGFFREELGARVASVVDEEWDGARVRLSHGDEVDRSWGYAALSAGLRGPVFAALMRVAGPERGWRLLGRIAGAERAPVEGAEPGPLVSAQIREGKRLIEQGLDLVISGHTHAPGVFPHRHGRYVNLGDWPWRRCWGRWESGEFYLERAGAPDPAA